MHTVNRSALVPYRADEMFVIVADVARYQDFLPWCAKSEIISEGVDDWLAGMQISYKGIHKSFTTRNTHETAKWLEMRLEEGPFQHLLGRWDFDAIGDSGSKVSLNMEFDFSNRFIGRTLAPVFTKISNDLVDSFCQRAYEIYGKRNIDFD